MYISVPASFVEKLIEERKSFTAICTNYTMRIKTTFGNFIIGGDMKKKDLFFLVSVKNDIKKQIAAGAVPPPFAPIYYYRYNELVEEICSRTTTTGAQIYEVDLTGAYWEIAYKKGYLSKKMYEKGLLVDKPLRLKALGAIAVKRKTINYVDGEVFGDILNERDELLTKVWSDICHTISATLSGTIAAALFRDAFLFFWTDAVFVIGTEARDIVKNDLQAGGYKFTEEKINKIEIIKDYRGSKIPYLKVYGYEINPKTGELKFRPFPLIPNKAKMLTATNAGIMK